MNRHQQGFALVAAIILVVVLAGLTAFVASMVGGQSANQQLERMSHVVDLAAQAGLEWGAYQVMRQPLPICSPSTTLPALPGTLAAASVNVTCTSATTSEGGNPVTTYQITAKATYAGTNTSSPDYAERTKAAVFSR
ncbi:MAG: hypothetical protein WBX11_05355 [Thiobacillaceae bacterium]